MKCFWKVKTANAWFKNGTSAPHFAFELYSSLIHVWNTILVPFSCPFSLIFPPQKLEKNVDLSLVTIGKYVRNNLGSTTFPISHFIGGDYLN
jgi:hypothetical protein